MICAYLVHCKAFSTATQALKYYGEERTLNGKGVTIPSQIRYVGYYERFCKNNFQYEKNRKLFVKRIIFHHCSVDPTLGIDNFLY